MFTSTIARLSSLSMLRSRPGLSSSLLSAGLPLRGDGDSSSSTLSPALQDHRYEKRRTSRKKRGECLRKVRGRMLGREKKWRAGHSHQALLSLTSPSSSSWQDCAASPLPPPSPSLPTSSGSHFLSKETRRVKGYVRPEKFPNKVSNI